MGDNLLAFALAFKSATLDRPAATVMIFLAGLVPPILLGSLTGRLLDNYPLRTAIVGGASAQALLTAVLALDVGLPSEITILFAVATAGLLTSTGAQVVLGNMGDAAGRAWTDSIASFAVTAAATLAPAVGGTLYGSVGLRGVGIIDAITFAVLVAAVLRIHPDPPAAEVHGAQTSSAAERPTLRAKLAAWSSANVNGMRLLFGSRPLRASMTLIIVVIFSTCLEGVAGVYYFRRVAHNEVSTYGLIVASWSVGLAAGSLLPLLKRLNRSTLSLRLGSMLVGASLLTAAGVPNPVLAAVAFLVGGLGNGIVNTAIRTVINAGVDATQRGLAWGSFRTLSSLAIAAGFVLGAPGVLFAPRAAVTAAGALPLLAALVLVARGTAVGGVLTRQP